MGQLHILWREVRLLLYLSLVCSPQCPSCWFFFFPSFSSSLYLVHSFCLTKRKGEARKRTLCYLVSSCPTHLSGGTGLQTIITDECSPFPIIPNWLVCSIAEVESSNPIQARFFFWRLPFRNCKSCLFSTFITTKK